MATWSLEGLNSEVNDAKQRGVARDEGTYEGGEENVCGGWWAACSRQSAHPFKQCH